MAKILNDLKKNDLKNDPKKNVKIPDYKLVYSSGIHFLTAHTRSRE